MMASRIRSALWAALALAGAASADTAAGLRLPLEALSVWRIDGSTAWGLELTAAARRVDRGSKTFVRETDQNYYWLTVAGTRMRFRETGHDVRPFSYLRGETGYSHIDDHGHVYSVFLVNVTAGAGVAWEPFDRVGLWVRKGLEARYQYTGRSDLKSFSLTLRKAPQVIAYFRF